MRVCFQTAIESNKITRGGEVKQYPTSINWQTLGVRRLRAELNAINNYFSFHACRTQPTPFKTIKLLFASSDKQTDAKLIARENVMHAPPTCIHNPFIHFPPSPTTDTKMRRHCFNSNHPRRVTGYARLRVWPLPNPESLNLSDALMCSVLYGSRTNYIPFVTSQPSIQLKSVKRTKRLCTRSWWQTEANVQISHIMRLRLDSRTRQSFSGRREGLQKHTHTHIHKRTMPMRDRQQIKWEFMHEHMYIYKWNHVCLCTQCQSLVGTGTQSQQVRRFKSFGVILARLWTLDLLMVLGFCAFK